MTLRDHPRACGAHAEVDAELVAGWGSSPRMRGSRLCRLFDADEAGIIPAHAGLTAERPVHSHDHRDHPRACGAHDAPGGRAHDAQGSSPRMRGSPGLRLDACADDGIIPAHAGLTDADTYNAMLAEDHPRACGAHALWHSMHRSMRGSSPRMRGSLEHTAKAKGRLGIIPAHAGLTRYGQKQNDTIGDHPRACGAHNASCIVVIEKLGSSPRMRGSHYRRP